MTFILRGPERDIELGPTLEVLSALSEIGRAFAVPEVDFRELLSVIETNEEEMPPEFMAAVQRQAVALLESEELSDAGRGILSMLAGDSKPQKESYSMAQPNQYAPHFKEAFCKAGYALQAAGVKPEKYQEQPSKEIDPEEAKRVLRKEARGGCELSEAQRGMFGAAAGRAKD